MLTKSEEAIVQWLRQVKVATMEQLRQRFQVSHMTVVRALNKHGYFSSYNHNGKFYVLRDVPQFDEWGLWNWRNVRFSQHGTLIDTAIHLVEQAPAGYTTEELTARLLVDVAHLLSRLVREQRISQQALDGRRVVYLSAQTDRARSQWQERRQLPMATVRKGRVGLPVGIAAQRVIDILRQMIVAPEGRPELWARQLKTHGVPASAGEVQRVIEHYALEKKRPS
jgi:hypothetical protein